MADLAIVPSQVVPGPGAQLVRGTAGDAITAGEPCALEAATQRYRYAFSAIQARATCVGIALHAAAVGQPLTLQRAGDIILGAGAAPVVGDIYVLSRNAARIAPAADLVTGNYTSVVGVGVAPTMLRLALNNSGVPHA